MTIVSTRPSQRSFLQDPHDYPFYKTLMTILSPRPSVRSFLQDPHDDPFYKTLMTILSTRPSRRSFLQDHLVKDTLNCERIPDQRQSARDLTSYRPCTLSKEPRAIKTPTTGEQLLDAIYTTFTYVSPFTREPSVLKIRPHCRKLSH